MEYRLFVKETLNEPVFLFLTVFNYACKINIVFYGICYVHKYFYFLCFNV